VPCFVSVFYRFIAYLVNSFPHLLSFRHIHHEIIWKNRNIKQKGKCKFWKHFGKSSICSSWANFQFPTMFSKSHLLQKCIVYVSSKDLTFSSINFIKTDPQEKKPMKIWNSRYKEKVTFKWKHCRKWSICSWWANASVATMFSISIIFIGASVAERVNN